MRFIWKLLLVAVFVFSVVFVLKLLIDDWIYSLAHPFLWFVMVVKPKVLPCLFEGDAVLCSWRKTEQFAVLERCFKCPHYLRFVQEMDAEEDAFWEEEERLRGEGSHG